MYAIILKFAAKMSQPFDGRLKLPTSKAGHAAHLLTANNSAASPSNKPEDKLILRSIKVACNNKSSINMNIVYDPYPDCARLDCARPFIILGSGL